jgi:iron complex outermembrane receptor protein
MWKRHNLLPNSRTSRIQQQGFVSVGQILQNVSSVGSSGTSQQSSLGGIVGQYASLRGLGAPRTLILVDGERYTTDIFGQTDLSTIPSSLIDSVEILQDGASSTYGSDAISGVINIHTKNVDGLYLDTYNSTYSPGNFGKQSQFSLTGGKKFSRGSFTFNMTVQNTNQILSSQAWFSKNGYFSFPKYAGLGGTIGLRHHPWCQWHAARQSDDGQHGPERA